MGARTSRRQMTEAPRVTLDVLPPELMVRMLSYLTPRALVTCCRPVCRVWRDVVDDSCALAGSCLRAPLGLGRNLLSGTEELQRLGRGKESDSGARAFLPDRLHDFFRSHIDQADFERSQKCFKRQLVDLVMEGVWQELLDSAQIEIVIADWGAKMEWATESHSDGLDAPDAVRVDRTLFQVQESLALSLLPPDPESWLGGRDMKTHCHLAGGAPGRTVAASTGFKSAYWMTMKMKWPHPAQSVSEFRISKVFHAFTDFGKGICYVSFEQYGRVIHSWVRHYGVIVACSSVWVRICRS